MFNLPVSNMLCVSSESGHVLELELLVLLKLQSIDGTALQLMAVHFWASWPLSLNTKQTCRSWFLDSWRAWPGEEQEREREREREITTCIYLILLVQYTRFSRQLDTAHGWTTGYYRLLPMLMAACGCSWCIAKYFAKSCAASLRTMNLLALPLEREQIYSIKRRFPGFSGKAGSV